MGIAEIMAIVSGVLQFPGQILALIKILRSTPAENQEKIMIQIQDAAHKFNETGRPTWP